METINWNLSERLARIAFSTIAEPGDEAVAAFCQEAGGFAPAIRTLSEYMGEDQRVLAWKGALLSRSLQQVTHRMQRINTLIPGDLYWPQERLEILGDAAPWILYYTGDATILDEERSLAVVGARAATVYGDQVTHEWVQAISQESVAIVSGGAYGIDAAAHRAALDVGGMTMAVMAGGLDRLYPSGNHELLQRVATDGLLLSEMPPTSIPTKWRFLARNRLIAALSHATLVVEAGHRSGSLNTLRHAVEMGKPVGAVPGPVTSAASGGSNMAIANGRAKLMPTYEAVLELGGWL